MKLAVVLPLNLPNTITVVRIAACPVIFILALQPHAGWLMLAFWLFVAAAVSDLWDGYLARKHGIVTDLGKLLDPLADKLLLVSTFLPFYLIGREPDPLTDLPFWGGMPLWVLVVIFGREVAITVFRSWAAGRRGSVIAAGSSGKIKAFVQNIFCGSFLLWLSLVRFATEEGWTSHVLWEYWSVFHGTVVVLSLAVAIVLTVYSLAVYLRENRHLFRAGSVPGGAE
ncbi:MAG: CDP-diacylglycerol--glycerol-3-phosphate 3-phosphatidyltransferase [Gemmatimonadales bacterium]|nr:MAG: CDP-diacylglycerol--glycerol-3-phosphate 3-phosphatidyltransferase [Gemmatimonadales bacterium]